MEAIITPWDVFEMRKFVTVIIVGAMMLTLFLGLFGGVVEEVEGSATYDTGTNTIIVTDSPNTLATIDIAIDLIDPSIFWYNSSDASYSTKANILVADGANLRFFGNDILKFDMNASDELNLTVSGVIEVLGESAANPVTFTSNESTPAAGDWEGIIFNTLTASFSEVNFFNISYAMIGIFCDASAPTIENSRINNCSDNGIIINGASPIIDNVEISNNGNGGGDDAGLLVISSSPIIENTTFLANPDRDIFLKSDSHPISLNSSSSWGKIFFNDAISNITVKWYLDVYVEDNVTASPVQEATVWVGDWYGNPEGNSPFTTNTEGHAQWIQAVEYIRNSSGLTDYTPHNITVTHNDYYTGYAEPEPTIDTSKLVQVNLTMISKDLTTNAENITFSPSGVPVAGEDLTVYAKIHNIEIESAHDVRVIIIDNTTESEQEIYNSEISEIQGNSFKNAIEVWQPTPGNHRIDVFIDPFNEIKEVNSDPGIDAEANNDASTTIEVNARPTINITEPEENDEVNGTIFINGTAWDDIRDDEIGLPINNITRVDIRLEEPDWIELYPPLDITPINTSGGFEWHYEWDTNYWDGTPLADGIYTIQAKAWDNYHNSSIYSVQVTVNNSMGNTPPNAVINEPQEPNAFNVSDVITFNSSDSDDDKTLPEYLNHTWDFDHTVDSDGDGNFTNDEDAFGNITTYAYDKKGSFDVTLKVTDEGDLNDTAVVTVNILNYRPVANITVTNSTPTVNQTVTFNGTGSHDPDGVITTYFWDFDDGTFSPLPIVNHSFNETRIFNVTLTVTDNNATLNSTWILIDVSSNSPPNAVITSPPSGSEYNVGEVITFDGSDSNDAETAQEDLNFTWDFDHTVDSNGDGNFTNDEDAYGNITTYAYNEKGLFNITLLVTDEGGLNDTAVVTVNIWNYLPVANITVNSTQVYENQTVTFNGTNSTDPDGVITSYFWDFDDGDISFLPIADHTFNETRIFNVTLTVYDNNATYNSTWILINVQPNEPPNAIIDEPFEGEFFSVNETIIFNATSSWDTNDEDLEYYWDFGDGNSSGWITEPSTTHYYSDYGAFPLFNYTVRLRVRDNEELEDEDQVDIIVNNYPPVAVADANITVAMTNQDITFDGSDSYDDDGTITNYLWDFGEGNTSLGMIVEHQFSQDGVYYVNLTVTDNLLATNTTTIMITIINRDPIIYEALANPQTAYVGEEITFNVTANDTDGYVVMYEWDFGDGSGYNDFTSELGNTTYSYSSIGEYIARIRITDDDGNTSIAEVNIDIENTPPEITITSPIEDEPVEGIISITGNAWDVDGDVSLVEVKIDNGDWKLATDNSGNGSWFEWTYSWDTRDVNNGTHKIYARANDSESWSDPLTNVSVIVANEPSGIEVTSNLNPSTVEAGGTVEVYGYVTYDTGGPTENVEINISIQNEVGYWLNTTDSNGYYTVQITAPSEAGTYVVRVNAKKNSFTDVDQKTLQVIETTEPDLKVSTDDIAFYPSAPDSGDTVEIRITVHNIGNADANNVGVNVYTGDSDSRDTLIGSDTITNIAAGGNQLATVDWDTSGISGEVYIYAVLDPNKIITESDETNNEASKPITVQGKPDFAIADGDITFGTQNPKQGETFTILIKINNIGSQDGTVNYKVYDGDPDAGGKEIDSGNVPIAADDDETESVEWTPDEGGEHDIWVRLDPNDIVDEFREDNNDAHKTITVEALPPEEGIPGWLIPLIVILVVVVLLIVFILSRKGKGPKPEQEIPLAKVVEKEVEATEEEKEEEKKEGLLESHGGIRIG